MTAILAWFNQEPQMLGHIMAVGDTKITTTKAGTLEGAKIFELPIRCLNLILPHRPPYFSSSIGFAYAGSTLVGFNVYAFLQSSFANLSGIPMHNNRPDAPSMAEKARQALELYVRAIKSPAEIMLFGFCPRDNIPFIATIRTIEPVECGDITFDLDIKTEFNQSVEYVLLGDHKIDITERLTEELEIVEVDNTYYWRKPAKVLRDIIRAGAYESIGGSLQIALCFAEMYATYGLLTTIDREPLHLKFRNMDFTEDIMGNVGDCNISFGGYTIEPM